MNIKKYIPNTITCFNLVSGCVATVMALQGDIRLAAYWIIIAAVLDFFDGLAARLLKAYSPIGKELDSLADVVSFGVAPGMIMFHVLGVACQGLPYGTWLLYLPYIAFVIPAFSGLRLAKFNIDDRQTTSFLGLPVPAHALFWASAGYTYASLPAAPPHAVWFVAGMIVLMIATSLLLVSELPMFSFKIKSFAWKGNEQCYLLVVSAVVFVVLWGFLGIAGTILLYIILSIFNKYR